MNAQFLLFALIALAFTACDREDRISSEASLNDQALLQDNAESEADRAITRQIRQLILADDSLSPDAKNIQIITLKKTVTLRGPVPNQREKDAIVRKINQTQGVLSLNNQLEVNRQNQ